MAQNIPLTDADRWDWLILLREAAVTRLSTPSPNSSTLPEGVIVTCSALKQKYRDVMRVATYNHPDVRIHFVYLRADESVLMQRVNARQGHYMKSSMVHSQFEMLEEPDAEWDALAIDVAASPAEVQRKVLAVVQSKLAEEEERR
jgi:gluconokinase